MTTKLHSDGTVLDYVATAAITAGDAIVLGTSTEKAIGVALTDIASGATGSVAIEGAFDLPKVSGAVIVAGDAVYWDVSASAVDDDAATKGAGDFTCGVAMEAAGSGVTTIPVKLNGRTTAVT